MLRKTGQWDIRCPRALARMFPVRRGYYYKVDRAQARRIVRILAKAYGLATPPRIAATPPPRGWRGTYHAGQIWVHARGHMKSTFHEFYHYLEDCNAAYDSRDNAGGPTSLAWQFADRLFEELRKQRP